MGWHKTTFVLMKTISNRMAIVPSPIEIPMIWAVSMVNSVWVPPPWGSGVLGVEVEVELGWVWAKGDVLHFFLALPAQPAVNEVHRKHVTAQQELMVVLQCVEGFGQ